MQLKGHLFSFRSPCEIDVANYPGLLERESMKLRGWHTCIRLGKISVDLKYCLLGISNENHYYLSILFDNVIWFFNDGMSNSNRKIRFATLKMISSNHEFMIPTKHHPLVKTVEMQNCTYKLLVLGRTWW